MTSQGKFNTAGSAVDEIDDRRQQVERLTSELRRRDAAIRSQEVLIASLQEKLAEANEELQRLSSKNTDAEVRLSLEQLRSRKALTKQEAARVRNTISYRLGHALIHGFKSWSTAIALPRTLMAIHLDARRRRKLEPASDGKPVPRRPLPQVTAPASLPPPAPASSTREVWSHPYVKLQRTEKAASGPRLFAIGSSLGDPAPAHVMLTPQNFEYKISQSEGPTVRVYHNQRLAGTAWGRLFDFDEMQNFKRFLELRKLVCERGGRVEIIREDNAVAPLLFYMRD